MPEGKKKKPTRQNTEVIEQNTKSLRGLLKCYKEESVEANSVPCTEVTKVIRSLIEDGEGGLLREVFLRPIPLKKPIEPSDESTANAEPIPIPQTHVRPLVRALITTRNETIKVFCVWNLCMDLMDCIDLNAYLKLPTTYVQTLILNDCLLQPYSLSRLTLDYFIYGTLRIVNLDFNEFGDEGCSILCSNLLKNHGIFRLSLTYCDIGPDSGKALGELLVQSAVRELYLDGNRLGCTGANDLIKSLVVECEKVLSDKRDRIRAENELKAQEALLREQQGLPPEPVVVEKKKKKKKKKKKQLDEEFPPYGAIVSKLHLFDNEIDCLQPNGLTIVQETINTYARLIEISEDLEELDLDENVIGHVCGGILLDALKARKENKLKKIRINVSEKIDQYVFADILKLSAKLKKKRKRAKKK
ncbi:unnamed protein product, partial [Adineta ricciae]